MNPTDEIRALLQRFQDGYIKRDISQVDAFMGLFTDDGEVIGTNGVKPGVEEWYTNRASARELVEGDWTGWGDVRLDLASMSIHNRGDVGWVAASATVTQTIGSENYASYLEYVKSYIDKPELSAEQKLLNILRGGTNTVFELRRGEKFVWGVALYGCCRTRSEWLEICPDEFLVSDHLFPRCEVIRIA